jgi:integrase
MADRQDVYGRGSLEWISQGPGDCVARLTIELQRGPDGKRRRKMITLRGSKRDIEKQRTKILGELNSGDFVAASPSTLGAYLDYWLTNAVKPRLAERTFENYSQYVEYYIRPNLGAIRLADLSTAMVQAFYTRLLTAGRIRKLACKSAGLSPTTVNNVHRVFHEAMDWAVKWQFITKNPTEHVAVSKPEKRKQVILDRNQVATILSSVQDYKLRLVVMIGICTGLRRGEIVGLRWADVDLDRGLLMIQHSMVNTGKRIISKGPKTEAGARPLMMPSVLTDLLRERKDEVAAQKEILDSAYQDHDLVVCWEDGRPVHPHRFYKPLRNLLRRLNLPDGVCLHDLRHSHATHLLLDGVHPKAVSERLGHENVETTLNLYSHILPHIQKEAAESTDKALRDALERSNNVVQSEE